MLLGDMLITQVSYNQNNEQEACESVDQCEATYYHSLRHGCDAAGAEADKSPWCVDGQYGWRVHMVVPIQPIPIKGELGQWTLPPALRLLLALHIRCHLRCLPPCESMSPGSPPPEIAALNHGRRNGEAAQASDDEPTSETEQHDLRYLHGFHLGPWPLVCSTFPILLSD